MALYGGEFKILNFTFVTFEGHLNFKYPINSMNLFKQGMFLLIAEVLCCNCRIYDEKCCYKLKYFEIKISHARSCDV